MSYRLKFIVFPICTFWLILFGRLIHLQSWQSEELGKRANRQHSFKQTIAARPGDIVDRKGRLLATSVKTQSLYLIPKQIEDPQSIARSIAQALDLSEKSLEEKILKHRGKYFIWVKRRLNSDEATRIRELDLPRGTWGFEQEFRRHYPQKELAAHLIGLRDIDGKGQGGIEQSFNSDIQGMPGERTLIRDSRGRIIDMEEYSIRHPVDGKTIVLTIDSILQFHAEKDLEALMEEWKPKGACVTVMNPKTGEILASASRPVFNPNTPQEAKPADWKNLNTSAVFEPGSTFKPFVVAWALEQNLIEKEETFHCEHGVYRMGPRVLHDHHRYGELSLTDVLVKSSNIGMAKIGERLTNENLYRASIMFGFGNKTGSGLPGELNGILQSYDKWNIYSTGSIPMGQEIAVTPLQLITAHAALANGGVYQQPDLILKKLDSSFIHTKGFQLQEESTNIKVISPLIKPEICQWLIEKPMTEVVTRGTGKKAQLENYSVFGKTGTAQKIDPETGQYSHTQLVCSFICGAPSDNPQAIVLVVVDEPTEGTPFYGGTVAAPTASKILEKTLVHLEQQENNRDIKLAKKPSEK